MKLALDTGGFGKETASSLKVSKPVSNSRLFPLTWQIASAFGHLSLCIEIASGVPQSLQSSTELVAQSVTY